jgi:hypothetical protein
MDELIQQFEELKVTVFSKGDDDNSPSGKELIESYLKVGWLITMTASFDCT